MVRKSVQTRARLQKYYTKRKEMDKTIKTLEETLKNEENVEAGEVVRSYSLTIEELADLLDRLKGHLPESADDPEEDEEEEEYDDDEEIY